MTELRENENGFAPALLATIAGRVADGIAAMRDPSIRVPKADEYRNGDLLVDGEARSMLVEIAVDGMALPVHAGVEHYDSASRDGGAELAALIVARERAVHARRLRQLRELVDEGLGLDDPGVTLLDVGCAPVRAEEPVAPRDTWLTARVDALDAALRPFRMQAAGRSPGEAAAEVEDLAPQQRRRRRARERLAAVGAAIEIDVVAERAIASAGLTLTSVARHLIDFHSRDEVERPYLLPGADEAIDIVLTLEDGCIVALIVVPGKVTCWGERLQLHHALPETTAVAAIGRPATDVVPLPALAGVATIVGEDVTDDGSRFTLSIPRRPLAVEEIGE